MYLYKKTREKVENRRFPAFFLFCGTLVSQAPKNQNWKIWSEIGKNWKFKKSNVGTIFATLYI